MYLPQFHQIPENDEWWGEGFTEWTAVKSAKKIFDGHIQPRHPLNNNYYNLLEKKTMKWQAELMKKFGIDGFCFYHYYFKNGRKILEKPAENLLRWKDIPINYCFSWASGSWTRTWSNLKGNSWADVYEPEKTKNDNGILLEQDFGREEQWKEHFEYLVPFFRDHRYIKVCNRPVFCFFSNFSCISSMISYWRRLSDYYDIEKPYFIGFNINQSVPGLDAIVIHSPHMVWDINTASSNEGIKKISFDVIWDNILNYSKVSTRKIYFEGVGNFDDTPRRGSISGVVCEGYNSKKLKSNMEELYLKSYAYDNELVFFNAWNEWGEGMYLEPDEEEGYSRLEAVKKAKKGADERLEADGDTILEKYRSMVKTVNNNHEYELVKAKQRATCLNILLDYYDGNIKIGEKLKYFGIESLAVYGYGQVGRHLIKILINEGIEIAYIIDNKQITNTEDTYVFYKTDDSLPMVDAIIITPTHDYYDICEKLNDKVSIDCRLISIKELFTDDVRE